jgi:uncharacterized membrane-anchored protein
MLRVRMLPRLKAARFLVYCEKPFHIAYSMTLANRALPDDDVERRLIHDEVHARPSARIALPALVVYVAVLNRDISVALEIAHLARLSGRDLQTELAQHANFYRTDLDHDICLTWERHGEFTSYAFVMPLSAGDAPQSINDLAATAPETLFESRMPAEWLQQILGKTVAAVKLAMLHADISAQDEVLQQARKYFAGNSVTASLMGARGHSLAVTDFMLQADGFEHMLVVAPVGTTETRAGRISQRLLELETYRLMALKGLPVAKALGPSLSQADHQLVEITRKLESKETSDQLLLEQLISLAAMIERATTEHIYRFSATRAYAALVDQRITELRENAIPGTQTIGEFMRRRFSPAIATVMSTSDRLNSLSERVSRVSALLRTRVDIATEVQSQHLLQKLTHGQELQLRLQATVEGLSIAAISYYVVSLLFYLAKAAKAAGLPIHVEITTGALIPLVVWVVWRMTREVHKKLRAG